MGSDERVDSVNSRGPAPLDDPDKTLTSPRFGEGSIQHARPAVPIAHGAPRGAGGRSRPAALVALAVAAGIVGGIVGIFALNFAQRRAASNAPAAAAQSRARQDGTRSEAAATPNPATAATAAARASDLNANARIETREGGAPVADMGRQPATGAPVAAGEEGGEARELRAALGDWLAATNARDIDRQMTFYDAKIDAYYLKRHASRESVRAEKGIVFARATGVDVRADEPRISVSPDGQTAAVRFRKQYRIEGAGQERRGAVIQELRWRRTPAGWKITSERDLKIVE